jgi:hypothetical protein
VDRYQHSAPSAQRETQLWLRPNKRPPLRTFRCGSSMAGLKPEWFITRRALMVRSSFVSSRCQKPATKLEDFNDTKVNARRACVLSDATAASEIKDRKVKIMRTISTVIQHRHALRILSAIVLSIAIGVVGTTACDSLRAFVNQSSAQLVRALTEQASQLIDAAAQIRTALARQ